MNPSRFNFRIWNKPRKDFRGRMSFIDLYWFEENFARSIEDIPEDVVLMQSTGQTDKDGKEVFEGDVVRLSVDHWNESERNVYKKYYMREVKWLPATMCFHVGFNVGLSKTEIIGNVYASPELKEKCGE